MAFLLIRPTYTSHAPVREALSVLLTNRFHARVHACSTANASPSILGLRTSEGHATSSECFYCDRQASVLPLLVQPSCRRPDGNPETSELCGFRDLSKRYLAKA